MSAISNDVFIKEQLDGQIHDNHFIKTNFEIQQYVKTKFALV